MAARIFKKRFDWVRFSAVVCALRCCANGIQMSWLKGIGVDVAFSSTPGFLHFQGFTLPSLSYFSSLAVWLLDPTTASTVSSFHWPKYQNTPCTMVLNKTIFLSCISFQYPEFSFLRAPVGRWRQDKPTTTVVLTEQFVPGSNTVTWALLVPKGLSD